MRMSSGEKAKSRERIIAAAGRLFRAQGIDNTSVADVMREAGLTHGGFYRHFKDKTGLVSAAIEAGFAEFARPLHQSGQQAARHMFRENYLSREHRDNPGAGCPVAALAADIARAEPSLRAAMTAGIESIISGLARTQDGRIEALRELAGLVGAILIARTVDEPLSSEVLSAVRNR